MSQLDDNVGNFLKQTLVSYQNLDSTVGQNIGMYDLRPVIQR